MLTYNAPQNLQEWKDIYRLYYHSFPRLERKPFWMIVKMHRKGASDIWYFRREGEFAGIIITINGKNHILLDYLAVAKKSRGTGIGTEIMQMMRRHYTGKGVFLEIESVYERSKNQVERMRRKHFYEKAGMKSMEVFVRLFGVKMELMGFDCKLTYEEYHDFYRTNYSEWAANHVQKAEK